MLASLFNKWCHQVIVHELNRNIHTM